MLYVICVVIGIGIGVIGTLIYSKIYKDMFVLRSDWRLYIPGMVEFITREIEQEIKECKTYDVLVDWKSIKSEIVGYLQSATERREIK